MPWKSRRCGFFEEFKGVVDGMVEGNGRALLVCLLEGEVPVPLAECVVETETPINVGFVAATACVSEQVERSSKFARDEHQVAANEVAISAFRSKSREVWCIIECSHTEFICLHNVSAGNAERFVFGASRAGGKEEIAHGIVTLCAEIPQRFERRVGEQLRFIQLNLEFVNSTLS